MFNLVIAPAQCNVQEIPMPFHIVNLSIELEIERVRLKRVSELIAHTVTFSSAGILTTNV